MYENIAHISADDKKIESLYAHLDSTASLCKSYGEKIGIGKICELAGFAHDIGKASLAFQEYILSCNDMLNNVQNKKIVKKIDHSTMGAQYVHRVLCHDVAKFLSLAIMSHHTGLLDCVSLCGEKGSYQERIHKDIDYDNIYSRIDKNTLARLNNLVCSEEIVEEYGRIDANLPANEADRRGRRFQRGLLEKYIYSCLCDADRVCTAAFMGSRRFISRTTIPWSSLIDELDAHIRTFSTEGKVNKIRSNISQCCFDHATVCNGRIMQLSAPTGGGKTLSALRFALTHAHYNNMDRIIYVVPYTSIIEQNAHVARQIFENNYKLGDVVLECHSNLSAETGDERTRILSESWDAPIVFTTMVQFLESIYDSSISRTRRMHTLANSILIFDEIQCLPTQCMYLFNEFVRFITKVGRSTVVLCTATQPLLDRVPIDKNGFNRSLQIQNEDIMINDGSLLFSALRRVQLHDIRKAEGWSIEEICSYVGRLEANNVLVIVNTKASAKALYYALSSNEDIECRYLSTNMCPEHRFATIEHIRKILLSSKINSKKLVCVSTQLIEAGVDIDFECVIRFISGFDSIVQAAGRCNRHGTMHLGNVYIINPKNESLHHLPDIKVGIDVTNQLLDEYREDSHSMDDDIFSIKAIARYFDLLYYKLNNYNNKYFEYDVSKMDTTLFELLSQNIKITNSYLEGNSRDDFNYVLTQSFKMAGDYFRVIDSATQGVLVPYSDGKDIIYQLMQERDPVRITALLKKAQRYSINIYSNQFEKLIDRGIFEVQQGISIYYLDDSYYDELLGFCDSSKGTLII